MFVMVLLTVQMVQMKEKDVIWMNVNIKTAYVLMAVNKLHRYVLNFLLQCDKLHKNLFRGHCAYVQKEKYLVKMDTLVKTSMNVNHQVSVPNHALIWKKDTCVVAWLVTHWNQINIPVKLSVSIETFWLKFLSIVVNTFIDFFRSFCSILNHLQQTLHPYCRSQRTRVRKSTNNSGECCSNCFKHAHRHHILVWHEVKKDLKIR